MARIQFGTSGWRAILADEFTFANARRAVAAIAAVLKEDGRGGEFVLVGHDTRFLAGRFAAEAGRILVREGFRAELADRAVPTPVLAFEIRRQRAAGAINFTASHNPPQYLGLKFSTADGAPALPEVTRRIEARIEAEGDVDAAGQEDVARFDPVAPYLDDLSRKVSAADVGRGSPEFAVDFRFGTSSGFLDAFLQRAGARLTLLNERADPLFGGESPQCGEKELVGLGKAVRDRRARLGLSCDGDADRFGVCGSDGRYVQPNQILALLLYDLLARKGRRGGVARSVATTHALDAIAKKFGVPLYETPVGFKYIGEKLIAGEIIFGGEESAGLTVEGHVPEKDGILADLLVAEMVGARGQGIDELSRELEGVIGPFHSRRIDLALSPEARATLARVRSDPPERLAGKKVASINTLDGLKLLLEDGSWILVRESGTEPVARVYVEASSEDRLTSLGQAGELLLRGVGR